MKIVYEPVRVKIRDLKKVQDLINDIPSPKALVTTIQYLGDAEKINGCSLCAQILGCNVDALKRFHGKNIVYLGTGRFHPLMVKFFFPDREVFIVNPETLGTGKITEKDIYVFKSRISAGLDALKHARKVGIIVSIKPGQQKLEQAIFLKKKLERQGRKAYIFLFDNVNPEEFHNHKLDVLVNTACPRIGLDDASFFNIPVINIEFIRQ